MGQREDEVGGWKLWWELAQHESLLTAPHLSVSRSTWPNGTVVFIHLTDGVGKAMQPQRIIHIMRQIQQQ